MASTGELQSQQGSSIWRSWDAGRWSPQMSFGLSRGAPGTAGELHVGILGRMGDSVHRGSFGAAGELQAQQGSSILGQWGGLKKASTGELQAQQGSSSVAGELQAQQGTSMLA